MIKNTKTKKAMSLLSILALMMVVMTAIIVATPIITKRLTQIRTRSNYEKGYFLCYKYYDSKTNTTQLKQIRADIYDTGTVYSGPETVGSCQFQIPEGAEAFRITLIGGGGGGAGSKCTSTDEEDIHAVDNIAAMDFGTGKIGDAAGAFKNYISSTDILDQIKTYYTEKMLYLYTNGSEDEKKCMYSVNNLLDNEGYKENVTLTLQYASDKITVSPNNATYSYSGDSCSRTSTSTNCPTNCKNGDNIQTSINTANHLVKKTGQTTFSDDTPQAYWFYVAYKSYTSQNGGKGNAGDIQIKNTPFLRSANNTNTITINEADIGSGGLGGFDDNNLQINGLAGGPTKLNVVISNDNEDEESTPVAKQLEAKGGLGGTPNITHQTLARNNTVSNANDTGYYIGITGGVQDSNNIPIIFTSKIGPIQGGSGAEARGNCTIDNSESKQYNSKCNGGHAVYAGSGGGGAALACKRLSTCNKLNISSTQPTYDDATSTISNSTPAPAINCPVDLDNIQYAYGKGGNGAGGAILIEW